MATINRTLYNIIVINNQENSRQIYTSDKLSEMLQSSGDIRNSPLFRLLYSNIFSLEKDEDYEIIGLHSPKKENWDVLYNMKSYEENRLRRLFNES
jgi:hypothetical protein